MIGKRPAPVIGNLTHFSFSGNRTGTVGVATSPRSPLDFKIQSPRGLKSYDVGGVGLGIVAALEKSLDVGCEIQANKALCNRNLNRSNPIPVNSIKNCCASRRDSGGFEEVGMDSLEEYTFVTCRLPGNKSFTKVYYDGGERIRRGHERTEFDRRNSKINCPSVFAISPATFGEPTALPASDFLSSCHWCKKKLHGKDIYMYREKAFCGTECRYRQIVMDEHKDKEKCSTEVSRSADISSSSYKNGQIFSPGILAI